MIVRCEIEDNNRHRRPLLSGNHLRSVDREQQYAVYDDVAQYIDDTNRDPEGWLEGETSVAILNR